MRLTQRTESGLQIIFVSGSTSLGEASMLRRSLFELIERQPGGGMIVNLGGVSEVDTFTLQALFAAHQHAKKKNVPFALTEVRGRWKQLLRVAKLDNAFTLYTTMGSAMAAMRPSQNAAPSSLVA